MGKKTAELKIEQSKHEHISVSLTFVVDVLTSQQYADSNFLSVVRLHLALSALTSLQLFVTLPLKTFQLVNVKIGLLFFYLRTVFYFIIYIYFFLLDFIGVCVYILSVFV